MPSPVSAAPLKNERIVAIPYTLSISDDGNWLAGVKQAASLVGANLQSINGQGTTTGETSAIEQAISLKPAAILLFGVTETDVSAAISDLKASRIPWDDVYDNTGNGGYKINADNPAVGKLEAEYVLSQTACHPDSVAFTSSVFTANVVLEVNAYSAEIKSVCPSCTTTIVNIDPTQISTVVQPDTVNALLRDPKVDYFLAGYDGLASYMDAGISQSGKKVPLIGNTGTILNVQAVADGQPQVADVEHVSDNELAYMSIDDALREIAGVAPAAEWWPVSNLLITPANAVAAEKYLASTSYIASFKKIWGLG
jgi:ribose transport system substrate-binding protein